MEESVKFANEIDIGESVRTRRGLPNQSKLPRRIKRAVEFTVENYRREINLSLVASEVGLDRCYLSRKFKESFGTTYLRFLNELRMDDARALLRSSDMPISEVAAFVGFRDLSTFERNFKTIVGCSAREFRGRGIEGLNPNSYASNLSKNAGI